jgi:hypothetical protein
VAHVLGLCVDEEEEEVEEEVDRVGNVYMHGESSRVDADKVYMTDCSGMSPHSVIIDQNIPSALHYACGIRPLVTLMIKGPISPLFLALLSRMSVKAGAKTRLQQVFIVPWLKLRFAEIFPRLLQDSAESLP